MNTARLLVAAATLGLLAEAAEARPLVCLFDDAQWLDRASAQTFLFVARRLAAERIAIVIGVREPGDAPDFADLPFLRLGGLPEPQTAEERAAEAERAVSSGQRDRMLAEARRLEAAGLTTSRTEPAADGSSRNRTVYSITPAGRTTLAEWLAKPPEVTALHLEPLLRVHLARFGTRDDLLAAIDSAERSAEDLLADADAVARALDDESSA